MTELISPSSPQLPQFVSFLDTAEAWLAETENPEDMKLIHDRTAAIERLCRTIDEAKEIMTRASIVRVKAERQLGLWLSENMRMGPKLGPTLDDLQITKNDSSKWQLIAELPEEKFNEFIDTRIASGWDITTGGLVNYARNSLGRPQPSRMLNKVLLLDPSDNECSLQGYKVGCRTDVPLTTEHIVRRSAYQGGSEELKAYYEDPMNKALTCVNHNVGKWADHRSAVRILLFQKTYRFGVTAVRLYFNSAPWKVFPPDWTFEAMYDDP